MRYVQLLGLLFTGLATFGAAGAEPSRVPILYSTDLYHPHDDPDDHFDLLTLFAIPEFDIRGIVIDTGERGKDRPAIPALKQVVYLTGRQVPFAMGLLQNLKSFEDNGLDQAEPAQAGVTLILKTLRESSGPVTVFATGSLRDVAAAFNREPDLLRSKVGRLYVNAGHSGGEGEWNVDMDPNAYVRILRSGLPIYWVPCFGVEGYGSFWKFNQGLLLRDAPKPVQNFILYALEKVDPVKSDPVAFLNSTPEPGRLESIFAIERNMWCTGAFLHAAGRKLESCSFREVSVRVGDHGKTVLTPESPDSVKLMTFHVEAPSDYPVEMTRTLKSLLDTLTGPAREP